MDYLVGQILMVVAMLGVMIFALIAIIKACTRKSGGWIITAVFTGLLSLSIIGTGNALTQSMCWTLAGKDAGAFPIFDQVAATFTAKVTPASHLKTDLGADEIDQVELVMAIADDVAESWQRIEDIIRHVEKSVPAKSR